MTTRISDQTAQGIMLTLFVSSGKTLNELGLNPEQQIVVGKVIGSLLRRFWKKSSVDGVIQNDVFVGFINSEVPDFLESELNDLLDEDQIVAVASIVGEYLTQFMIVIAMI